jgi:hypothetical protein
MRTPLVVLALLVTATTSAACQSGKADRTGQTSAGFYAPNFEMLWEVTRKEMGRAGFTPDGDASSREGRVMQSRWATQLQPFSGRGYREQATVKLVPIPDRPDRWAVEANVIRQVNKTIKEPLNIAKAEWSDGDRVAEKEAQIVYGIESFFLGHDVSDRFRSTYGMPAGRTPIEAPQPVEPK